MAEIQPATESNPKAEGATTSDVGADLIDVLMRGLANSKQNLEIARSGERRGDTEPTIAGACVCLYVDSDHYCTVVYLKK